MDEADFSFISLVCPSFFMFHHDHPVLHSCQVQKKKDLSWNHCTSTPHRAETSGIAERAVRRVKEGTSAVLLQSGLDENWWADSMECYTHLRNIQDLLSDVKTPYERRLENLCEGPVKESINLERKSYLDCSSDTLCTRVEFGRVTMVADIEELETMDASEIYSKRLNAKEVIFPKEKGEFIFPIADGRIKTSWRRSRS